MTHSRKFHKNLEADFSLSPLGKNPQFVPVIAEWIFREWGRRSPSYSLDQSNELFKSRLDNQHPPLTFVGLLKGIPIATSSILLHELEAFPQYTHWLGSLYVAKGYRGNGIGSRVVNLTAQIGLNLGLPDLHLYTHSHEDFYASLGFTPIERTTHQGRKLVIMRRVLTQDASSEKLP